MKLPVSRLPRVAQRLVLPALLLAGASAQADLNFTFTGINIIPGAGYTIGQPYTFTFVVNGTFAVGSGNNFTSDTNGWIQSAPTDDTLFTSITGSGIGGSLTGTNTSQFGVLDNLIGPGADTLAFFFDGASGLTANGFPVLQSQLTVYNAGNLTDVFPGSYVAPQSIFSAVNGIVGPSDPSSEFYLLTSGGHPYFNLTSFTIENTATEVPFGVNSSVGLAALGLAGAWKLRRRKQAAVTAAN